MQALFGKTIDLLSTMLDFRAERHKVIVSNIANIETPDYKPGEIGFQKSLAEAWSQKNDLGLIRTDSRHFAPSTGKAAQFPFTASGDKVEIDKEMANLAENNLMYNFTVELLLRKFRGINTVLKETK